MYHGIVEVGSAEKGWASNSELMKVKALLKDQGYAFIGVSESVRVSISIYKESREAIDSLVYSADLIDGDWKENRA